MVDQPEQDLSALLRQSQIGAVQLTGHRRRQLTHRRVVRGPMCDLDEPIEVGLDLRPGTRGDLRVGTELVALCAVSMAINPVCASASS
jgi:hypothetical protein